MTKARRVYDNIAETAEWTPLVRLHRVVPGNAGEVFAKIEFTNPMGSVKDRIARFMVRKALQNGEIERGGRLVEASSGNTAMGMAMMAILEGLSCTMVVRKETSPEKLQVLRALGVDLVLVDGSLPPDHPESYNRKAAKVADELGAWFPDQHHNRQNNLAHYETTGPEIWEQMEGRIDWLVAGIGTGGTVSGVARYIKEQAPGIKVMAVDIEGSIFTEQYRTGQHGKARSYLLEGLGDEEMIGCPEFELIDEMVQVGDREAFLATRELASREAIFAGGSSGAALCGVRRLLASGGNPGRIVTIFPDSGWRYLRTIYQDDWMRKHGFL